MIERHRAEKRPKLMEDLMKTLAIANQKGGVGKTASAVHLAFDFAERGLRVAVIDLDTQGNASYTLRRYAVDHTARDFFVENGVASLEANPESNLTLIAANETIADIEQSSVSAAGRLLTKNVQAVSAKFDILIIDTPPALGVPFAASLMASNYVMTPIEPEAYSLQGVKRMLTVIQNMKRRGSKVRLLGMMPFKVDGRNPRHVENLAEIRRAYPDMVMEGKVGMRTTIADALASGAPVWRSRKTTARKARDELRAMAQQVNDSME